MNWHFSSRKHRRPADRPVSGSWVTPAILACARPGERELSALAAAGIALVVNLDSRNHPPHALHSAGLRELHLPVPDFHPPPPEILETGVAAIRQELNEGRKIAVHCGAGLGRTGTLLACYLVREGRTADDAIREVRRARPGSVETRGQELAVHEFASRIARSSLRRPPPDPGDESVSGRPAI